MRAKKHDRRTRAAHDAVEAGAMPVGSEGLPAKEVRKAGASEDAAGGKRTGKKAAGAAQERRKNGRPTMRTPEMEEEILDRIAIGEPVRQICMLAQMPDETTFYRWLVKDEEFRKRYRAAKEAQMDRMEEALIEIADDSRNDWLTRETERGGQQTQYHDEAVQRAKLRIWTRQWVMAKVKPKKYGDKVELAGEGAKTELTVNLALSKERLDEVRQLRRAALQDSQN